MTEPTIQDVIDAIADHDGKRPQAPQGSWVLYLILVALGGGGGWTMVDAADARTEQAVVLERIVNRLDSDKELHNRDIEQLRADFERDAEALANHDGLPYHRTTGRVLRESDEGAIIRELRSRR